jgi:hypothetical protein
MKLATLRGRQPKECIALAMIVLGLTVMSMQPAHADLMSTAVQYFYTNFATGLVGAAVMIAGALMLAGRMGLLLGVGIIGGAVVIGNYSTIASTLLGSSGGL